MTNPHPDPSAELARLKEETERLRVRPESSTHLDYNADLRRLGWALADVASLLESQRDEARRKVGVAADWIDGFRMMENLSSSANDDCLQIVKELQE